MTHFCHITSCLSTTPPDSTPSRTNTNPHPICFWIPSSIHPNNETSYHHQVRPSNIPFLLTFLSSMVAHSIMNQWDSIWRLVRYIHQELSILSCKPHDCFEIEVFLVITISGIQDHLFCEQLRDAKLRHGSPFSSFNHGRMFCGIFD